MTMYIKVESEDGIQNLLGRLFDISADANPRAKDLIRGLEKDYRGQTRYDGNPGDLIFVERIYSNPSKAKEIAAKWARLGYDDVRMFEDTNKSGAKFFVVSAYVTDEQSRHM